MHTRSLKSLWLLIPLVEMVVLFWASVGQAQQAEAEEVSDASMFSYGIETDFASKYLWRGLSFSQGVVSQNSVWLSVHNITLSVWGNYDFDAGLGQPSFNEIDFSLSGEQSFGALTVEPSIQVYEYPKSEESPWTSELSLSVSLGLPVVQPFMSHTLDVKAYPGAYFGELGISCEQSISSAVSVHAMAEVGWGSAEYNQAYTGISRSGVELYLVEADLSAYLTSSFYVRPHVAITSLGWHELADWVESRDQFQIGVAFGGEF